MRDLNSAAPKRRLQSRRQAVKLALLAGSTLAVGASPALADDSTATPTPSMSIAKPGQQGLVKPNSVTTPGTNYKIYMGSDFKPVASSYGYDHVNFTGIYATSSIGYFSATLDLPQQAKITEVEFYTVHNTSGSAQFILSLAVPSAGVQYPYVYETLTATSSNVATVSLTGSFSGIPKVDNTYYRVVLFWLPTGTGSNEVLYGARVGYTGGVGRFGA